MPTWPAVLVLLLLISVKRRFTIPGNPEQVLNQQKCGILPSETVRFTQLQRQEFTQRILQIRGYRTLVTGLFSTCFRFLSVNTLHLFFQVIDFMQICPMMFPVGTTFMLPIP